MLRYEMSYKNGERTGSWFMWDEEGNLVDEKYLNKITSAYSRKKGLGLSILIVNQSLII